MTQEEKTDSTQVIECKSFHPKGNRGSKAESRTARAYAMGGTAVWSVLAILARMGVARIGAIELLFLFAPLVIVPLGMELARTMGACGRLDSSARTLQPFGAALAVVAFLMAPGRRAGTAAAGWMAICLLLAGAGVIELLSCFRSNNCPEANRGVRATIAIAKTDLAVGGAWMMASRLGMRPMGIQEPIGLLTAVHFHFAGFATALIAAATLRFAKARQQDGYLKYVVGMVVTMPLVVATGFVIAPAVKMGAALAFSASVAALAIFVRASGRQARDANARVLLQISAAAIFVGMIFAAAYAIADFAGSEALTIPQMVRTHGILNAVGFCLPGLLAWIIESKLP